MERGKSKMVQPIKDETKIRDIKQLLSGEPRNLLLFTMGLNTGLRIGDILSLKVGDVSGLKIGDKVEITERKTGKHNYFVMNKEIHRVLKPYLEGEGIGMDDFLFPSRKGDNKPLRVDTTNKLVKLWTSQVGLKGNYGCHSLRKTWGYFMRWKHNVSLEVLMKRFSHSSQGITLRYIGLTSKDVDDCLSYSI